MKSKLMLEWMFSHKLLTKIKLLGKIILNCYYLKITAVQKLIYIAVFHVARIITML